MYYNLRCQGMSKEKKEKADKGEVEGLAMELWVRMGLKNNRRDTNGSLTGVQY